MQWTWRGGAGDAGDRAQILINGSQLFISLVAECRPRHHLQQGAVEMRGNTTLVRRTGACRMQVMEIRAVPHDLQKLFVGMTAFRPACFVGRQIARDDVGRPRDEWAEILAAAQVGRGIYDRFLYAQKIRVSLREIFGGGVSRMAS